MAWAGGTEWVEGPGPGVPGRTTADSHAALNIDRYGGAMALGRRLVLVAVLAAAIVGGMLPHAALSAVPGRTAEIVQAAEVPLAGPLHCLDATCGKGSPSAPTPTPGVVWPPSSAGWSRPSRRSPPRTRRRLRESPLPSGVTTRSSTHRSPPSSVRVLTDRFAPASAVGDPARTP